ncbi:hypothetical protein F0L74_11690 [Chitinophaga agrisoli]|uniref:Uncharacterized protein n=1 Tax=Chitinophaga agrisoli TaxID=2607653 RepID=A0A5B2VX47_9BACT|nr:hypothetical protein [Chitinophaga agrisoli]KAA2243170.1 hypothetical protein F0L74_11690 [Chitinophaga agrisoli]
MKFFRSLFSKPAAPPQPEAATSASFAREVLKAIVLLGESEHLSTDEEILRLFRDNGISETDAPEILLFLPIAFVRRWMPDYNWRDDYIETIHGTQIERKYSETKNYQLIWAVTQSYFQAAPRENVIKRVCARSAELHAINHLLSHGELLEDIELAPMTIIR